MPFCQKCGNAIKQGTIFCPNCGNKQTKKETKAKKSEIEKETEKEMKAKGMIKEIKCRCNRCGKVWHYLEGEEKRIKSQMCWSSYGQMTCCLPIQLYSKQQQGKWETEADKFKKCPKCGSHDIKKTSVYYKRT